MDLSWVTPTLVVALLSLWVAFFNYRRSNYAIVRLRDCSCSYTQSVRENGGETFAHFRVVLQNLGIPLNNLSMALSYTGPNGAGCYTVPLRANGDQRKREGQFAKGMITEFSLRSYQLDRGDRAFLASLEDLRRQDAALCLYADGFLVWTYCLAGRGDSFKRRWNRFASKVNRALDKQVGKNHEGSPIVRQGKLLPRFATPGFHASQFVKHIAVDHQTKPNGGHQPPG